MTVNKKSGAVLPPDVAAGARVTRVPGCVPQTSQYTRESEYGVSIPVP